MNVGLKGHAVHRSVENHGRGHAAEAKGAGEGRRFPMTMRHGGAATLSFQCATSQPSHLGRGTGLIDKDQALRVEVRLSCEPSPAQGCDVAPLLLGGVRCFF